MTGILISEGEENGENHGRARPCDAFSSVAEDDDIPNFSGITDFDSPSPPKPFAGICSLSFFYLRIPYAQTGFVTFTLH